MAVEPSCPAFLCHDDGEFRRALIKVLDQTHFAVTFAASDDEAVSVLRERTDEFRVVLLSVDLQTNRGLKPLEFLRDHRGGARCGVIILSDAHPDIRTVAPWADETLLKPVDPTYVATRARAYCNC